MSLCVIVYSDKWFYMGADSRMSNTINGKRYKMNDSVDKIKKVHDKLIFGAGSADLIEKICKEFAKQKYSNIETLRDISKYWSEKYIKVQEEEYIKEHYTFDAGVLVSDLTIIGLENNKPVIYSISSRNGYKIKKEYSKNNQLQVAVSGAKCPKVFNYIKKNIAQFENVEELYRSVYNVFSDEGIGGTLSVYKIDKQGIVKHMEEKIKDSREIAKIEGHYIATDAVISGDVVGSRFLGSSTNSAFVEIGVGGNSNLADFGVFRGGSASYPVFSVYDNLTTIDLRVGGGSNTPLSFLTVEIDNNTTRTYGTWDFEDCTVTGLKNSGYLTKEEVENMIAEAIAQHIVEYHSEE